MAFDLEFVPRGDGEFDVVAHGGAIIEVSRSDDGEWIFWSVRVGDTRFGGPEAIGPGSFRNWLNVLSNEDGRDA